MLRYLHIPSSGFVSFAKARTIILMHGFGASAEDLIPIVSMIDGQQRYNWVLPVAPIPIVGSQSSESLGYGWFPRDQRQQQQAFAGTYFPFLPQFDGEELQSGVVAIEELRRTLGIPYASLAIGGFSQGAIMAAEFLLQAAEPCAAAFLFSSSLIAETRWHAAIPPHTSTPFVQTHGYLDEILPFENGHTAYLLFKSKGFVGEFINFDGGHTIPSDGITAAAALLQRVFIP